MAITEDGRKYSVINIRRNHPRAYERWTDDEDNLMIQKYNLGLDTKELADLLERQPGAIESRIRKLFRGVQSSGSNELGINVLGVNLHFDWISVFRDEDVPYIFPQKITNYMKDNYGRPAIYRWNIYKDIPMDQKLIYIGETTKLCPGRLNGYLKPGPSQATNKRLNRKFINLADRGYKVQLEILRLGKFSISDITLTSADLYSKHTRRFIESLLIIYYLKRGHDLLNL